MRKLIFRLVVALGVVGGCTALNAQPKTSSDLLLADPFVLEDNGMFYIYGTGAKNGILVYESKDLKSWNGPCGATAGLALHKKDSHAEKNFWAPEVYKVGDRYVMTFSADEHIRYAFSTSPKGPFVQDEKASYLDERGIDSHIFIDDDGQPYMFWVRFDKGNVIFAAPMSRDLRSIDMPRVKRLIDVRDGTWERTTAEPMAHVAEGPFVIKHDGLYYLTYSCNHFKSQNYAVGYAVASSPMGPWTRFKGNPILHKHGGYVGTGHHAMLKTKAGDMYMVYHAHFNDTVIAPRRTLISPVEFRKSGSEQRLVVSNKIIEPKLNGIKLLPKSAFDTTVRGQNVALYTIRGGDLTMQVTNYGAKVVALWAPDRQGRYADVVLGYPDIRSYLDKRTSRFFGAVVGRYANRIAGGEFTLDSQTYHLTKNNRGQTLHGGAIGIDRVVWRVESVAADHIVLSHLDPDGLEGFPGNLKITMTYALTQDNGFKITYSAVTDKKGVVNLSNHSFFNLKGEAGGTITDNLLTIAASHYLPVDQMLIPTGEIAPVEGTPFDFRAPRQIGERIGADHPQIKIGGGYDHNFVLDQHSADDVELAVTLYEPVSGRCMEVWTDQPGVQIFSGNMTGKLPLKSGKPTAYRESIAIETQKFPDSPHHPQFPSTVLDRGEVYKHTCIYKFGIKK